MTAKPAPLPPVDALSLAVAAASLTKFAYGDIPQPHYHEAEFEWWLIDGRWSVGLLQVSAANALWPDGKWTV